MLIALGLQLKLRVTRPLAAMMVLSGIIVAIIELLLRLDMNPAITNIAFISIGCRRSDGALSVALLLFGLLKGSFAWIRSAAGSATATSVATLSYRIYLFHMPIIAAAKYIAFPARTGTTVLVVLALGSLPIVGAVSFAANRLLEAPLLELRRKHEDRTSE
jgi:peptidoglycan/LPS O-acetylase OafA/YrhL